MIRVSNRAQGGFSIVEAMIAAVVLGIGLLGLVELHRTSIRGTVQAISAGQALEIGRQVVETIIAADYANLPNTSPGIPNNCPNGGAWAPPAPPPGFVPAGVTGCRATQRTFNATKSGLCTFFADEAPVNAGTNTSPFEAATVNGPASGRYRIDTALHGHPNVAQYPNAVLATVWVCWQDGVGIVHEVRTSRVLTQDL